LEQGQSVSFDIYGFTSKKRASKKEFNNLTNRRIDSVINAIEAYNNGILRKYLANGSLEIRSQSPRKNTQGSTYAEYDAGFTKIPLGDSTSDLPAMVRVQHAVDHLQSSVMSEWSIRARRWRKRYKDSVVPTGKCPTRPTLQQSGATFATAKRLTAKPYRITTTCFHLLRLGTSATWS
jgi:hypothetical protein